MNEETTTILIDTALASGSATALDPEERNLQELVLALRDDAPSPDADFALRMNARVAAGFPSSRRRLRLPAFALRRPQLTALGAAASVLIAVVVAVSLSNGSSQPAQIPAVSALESAPDSSSSSAGSGSADSASSPATAAAPAQKAIAPSASGTTSSDSVAGPLPPVSPPPGGGFVGGQNRKVERSAALTLAAPKDKLSDVGDQVIAVTDRYRGFVLQSSVTSAGAQGSGSFDLRIPVRSLRPALRDLSALADVTSRTENAADVTASFVSARTRLQELNAERRGLLRRLASAQTDLAAGAIRSRIRTVNAQIDNQTRVMTDLRRRTSYAAVAVTLQAKQGGSSGGTGIGSGARDLRDSLIDAANMSLRVLGVALPIALLVALLWAGSSWFGRRRRESVLGQ
ncbi:MAG: hypothetical protein QOH13_2470 [Thermoleophilaceae bacterium]|nr:hypothetical protein [Thermoleophilaceae bacterium]